MNYLKKTLPSGLRVVLAPMASTKTVTLLVLVGTGANYEERKTNGLSHFLEHMFFKGTKNHPKPGELDRMLDAVGAIHNAFTSREETGYWVKVDAKRFDLALMMVSDILQNALLKEDELKKERGVILEEMKMFWDTPRRYVWSLFEELVYGDNPYGWDIIGTAENIKRMGRGAFVRYWRSQYVASNTIVVVAGNVSEGPTMRKIESAFKSIRRGKFSKEPKPPRVAAGPRVRILERNTDQTHLIVGSGGFALEDKNRFAADILATILGGYMSSRLFTEIRGKHGLAYSVSAAHQAYRNVGYFASYAGVPHAKTEEVASRIVSNFAKVKKSGVTTEELARAKDNIKGQLAISLESTDEVASFLGGQEVLLSKIRTPDEVIKKLERVTKDDVRRIARALFRAENLYLALIGPHKHAETYKSILGSV